jgi:ABC-type transport system involved in multi-copper enzyme maturation permease subunit
MSAIWVLAQLTLREALRRKLVAAGVAVSVALIGLSAWGFWKLSHNHTMTSGEVQLVIPQAFVLFMFMFSFVVALSASAIASPAVSSEVDSGVLQTVVTRPIRRSDVILGKWAGLAALLAAYSLLVTGVMAAVVHAVSGFTVPNFLAAAGFLFAEGAVLLTLVLLLSTRLSALAAGVIGVALFGMAWLAGVVGTLGTAFHVPALHTASEVSMYVLPTDGLWHAVIYYLEPPSYVTQTLGGLAQSHGGNPFFTAAGPTWPYLVWAALWFVIVLGLGLVSFERREL